MGGTPRNIWPVPLVGYPIQLKHEYRRSRPASHRLIKNTVLPTHRWSGSGPTSQSAARVALSRRPARPDRDWQAWSAESLFSLWSRRPYGSERSDAAISLRSSRCQYRGGAILHSHQLRGVLAVVVRYCLGL